MKKLMVAMLLVLAISFGAGLQTWALETFTGTIAEMETQEEEVAITVVTEEGNSLILYLDPAEVKDLNLRKGDRIRVTAEGEDIQLLEKLWPNKDVTEQAGLIPACRRVLALTSLTSPLLPYTPFRQSGRRARPSGKLL